MAALGHAVRPFELEVPDLTRTGIESRHRSHAIRLRVGDPDETILIHFRVMGAARLVGGGDSFHPVAAIMRDLFVGIRAGGIVILGDHDAGGFSSRPQIWFELDRRRPGTANLRQIGRQFVPIGVDQRLWNAVRLGRVAVDSHRLHHLDDLLPARFIKAVLEDEIRRVASGAVVPEDQLHAMVFGGVFRQAGHPFATR